MKLVLGSQWDHDQCARTLLQHQHRYGNTPAGVPRGDSLLRTFFVDTRAHVLRHVHASLPRLTARSSLNQSASSPGLPGGAAGSYMYLRMMSPSLAESAVRHVVTQDAFDSIVSNSTVVQIKTPTHM